MSGLTFLCVGPPPTYRTERSAFGGTCAISAAVTRTERIAAEAIVEEGEVCYIATASLSDDESLEQLFHMMKQMRARMLIFSGEVVLQGHRIASFRENGRHPPLWTIDFSAITEPALLRVDGDAQPG